MARFNLFHRQHPTEVASEEEQHLLTEDSVEAPENVPLIEVQHVSLRIGRKQILKDISFTISRREVVAIIGPSGSGKSTILKLIAGLIAPDAGTISVRSDRIGMAFQYSALLTSLSVFENVALPLRKTTDIPPEEIEKRVVEKLTMVGLGDVLNRSPEELSGGMKKRVSIARALAIEPDIILYDEPSAGLDPMTASKLEADMRKISQQVGAATVLVTHDLETIQHVADRVLILYDERIVWQGNRKEFLSSSDPYPTQFRERKIEGPISV